MGADVEQRVAADKSGNMSMRDMMMMQAMQSKQQPVVVNNKNQNYAYPQFAGWLQQQQQPLPPEQPSVEQQPPELQLGPNESKNDKILEDENKQVDEQKQ